ncbi:MAG: glycosyltransferase family 2 protein [Gallionella sp.]|nr:glycosyltransferase family 2 protein [Gallionella sp.]MDD4946154.1 glycosyltransferase family 2 protein [Gallionella sp.]
MSPRISIAMGTYNGARFIREQLDSFARQTWQPFELVVCDDGSTDDTLAIVAEFAKTVDFPVHIHCNEQNLGFSNNFMKCASLCKGDWIAFSDQDDVWFPEKFEKVVKRIGQSKSANLVLVCHSADLVDENLQSMGQRTPNFTRDETKGIAAHSGFLCIAGFTITFRADLLAEVDSSLRPGDYYAPGQRWQSHDKWIAMLANALGEVAYISESLAQYRRHTSAVTDTHKNPSAMGRVYKAAKVGTEFYQFQAYSAKDCAASFRNIASAMSDMQKRQKLLVAAGLYDRLAGICEMRSVLYAQEAMFSRLGTVFRLAARGGYWGSRFCSLGALSFFKDVAFGIGLLEKQPG